MAAMLLLLSGLALAQDVPTDGPDAPPPGEDEPDLDAGDLTLADPEPELAPPRLRPWLGAGLGLALNAGPLNPSPTPELRVGLVLPWLDERLRPFLGAGYNAPAADLAGDDPALADGWTATLRTAQTRLSLGIVGRLLGRDAPVSPELTLAPQLWAVRTVTETRTTSTVLSTSVEHELRPALGAGIGLGGSLGPGQLAAAATLTLAQSRGTLTGDAPLRSVDIGLSYRLEL